MESRVGMRLVHVMEVTGNTKRYRVQTAWTDRPETGDRTGKLRCAECREYVPFRVLSLKNARARRRWEFTIAVLGAAITAFCLWTLVRLDTADDLPFGLSIALLVGGSLAGFLAALALLFGLSEDGVAAVGKRFNSHHDFKPPNGREARWAPKKTDGPSPAHIVYDR